MTYEIKRKNLIGIIKFFVLALLSVVGIFVTILLLFKGKKASHQGKQHLDTIAGTVKEEFDNFAQ